MIKSKRCSFINDWHGQLNFSIEDVEKFWSKVAVHEYENANDTFSETHTQRFRISLKHLELKNNARLLNIWSRQGEAIPYIRKIYPNVSLHNFEVSSEMIRQSKQRFPDENFQYTDLCNIDFRDNYFDGIISLEMLEHSPYPTHIIKEMWRVLKPGCRLVLTCPSALSEIHLYFADKFLNNHGEGPHRFHSINLVKRMLRYTKLNLIFHKSTLFIPSELGKTFGILNRFCECLMQWDPANEFGLRQLYVCEK